MSFTSLSNLSSLQPSLGSSGLPAINQAAEPALVRDGSTAAKQAYAEGLDFEEVLVNQLAQELASTVSNSDTDAADGDAADSDDSGSSTSGLLGSDPASSGYESMIPDALTSAVMSSGGTGLALSLAQAIDPSAFVASRAKR